MANNYKNSKVDLTTTNVTTLYTTPSATQTVVKSLLVSNDSGSADTITVTITDSAGAIFSVYKNIDFKIVDKVIIESTMKCYGKRNFKGNCNNGR